MATILPRRVMRNCMMWADGTSLLGQMGDVTLPVPTVKTEDVRNAGMIMPIELMMGYEKLEWSFKMPGMDENVIALFGLAPGTEKQFLITGALVDEDGTAVNATVTVRGMIKSADAGTWKPGDLSENNYSCSARYFKLEIDGHNVLEMDAYTIKVGGVDQNAKVNAALLI